MIDEDMEEKVEKYLAEHPAVSLLSIAATLADMAEIEQIRAENINDRVDNLSAPQQAIKLSERDRHVARSGAFLEASRLILERVNNAE